MLGVFLKDLASKCRIINVEGGGCDMMRQEQIKEVLVAALNNGYIPKCNEPEKLGEMIAKIEKAYYDEIGK